MDSAFREGVAGKTLSHTDVCDVMLRTPKCTPKNYLVAWLLVMLKERNLHGYEIVKDLKAKFGVASEAAAVYRALRQLERDGFISSWWDPQAQGPARRVYMLTEQGGGALAVWSDALQQYRSNLDTFFDLYGADWVATRA